jgi:hypothetical protein
LKTFTNFKILPVTLFNVIVAAFRKPPVTVKLAPEPGCDSENGSVDRPSHVYLGRLFPCPMRGDHVKKPTNDKPEKNSDEAFGTSYRIRKCFHRDIKKIIHLVTQSF